jgi:hypothetical protein
MKRRRSTMAWPVSGLLLLCLAHVRTVAAELEPAANAAYDDMSPTRRRSFSSNTRRTANARATAR